MATQIRATKANLMAAKKSLALAKTGYDLLDRKRNILIRETMSLIDSAKELQSQIDSIFADAYSALQTANLTLGICDMAAQCVPVDNSLEVRYRSVMGVEIPDVTAAQTEIQNYYGFYASGSALDEAYIKFDRVKHLIVTLAQVENGVYRLAAAIAKTGKRANALKNIVIPRFEHEISHISEALEEKEIEEYSRLKIIKRTKSK